MLLDSANQEITLHWKAWRFIVVWTRAQLRVPLLKAINSRRKTLQLRYMPVRIFIYNIFFSVFILTFSPYSSLSPVRWLASVHVGQACCAEQDSTSAPTERAVPSCRAPGLNSRGAESEWRLFARVKGLFLCHLVKFRRVIPIRPRLLLAAFFPFHYSLIFLSFYPRLPKLLTVLFHALQIN
jgi:hypothetical protein